MAKDSYDRISVANIIKNEGLLYAITNFLNASEISPKEKELATLWGKAQKEIESFEAWIKDDGNGWKPGILIHNEKGYAIISDPPYKEIPVSILSKEGKEKIENIHLTLMKILKKVGVSEAGFNDKHTPMAKGKKVDTAKLDGLKSALALAEKSIGKDAIKSNPVLLKSLQAKITSLKAEIAELESVSPAAKTIKKEKPSVRPIIPQPADRVEWENEVYDYLGENYDITHGDASGILMVEENAAILDKYFESGKSGKAAAVAVMSGDKGSDPKPKKEKKAKAKTESASGSSNKAPYDCDELIAKAKERSKKAKEAAAKRADAPKKTQATKNAEKIDKVEENIEKRLDKGGVSKAELKKLIDETEALLKKLKAAFEKAK